MFKWFCKDCKCCQICGVFEQGIEFKGTFAGLCSFCRFSCNKEKSCPICETYVLVFNSFIN